MAATFFRRLSTAAPATLNNAFVGQPKSGFAGFRFAAIAAVAGGIGEETGPKVALKPDKWLEFKLQDTARVSHNTRLFRFSFDPNEKLGLDVASCILTRAPLGQDAEGKTKYVIRP